jgi:hypothetical protein
LSANGADFFVSGFAGRDREVRELARVGFALGVGPAPRREKPTKHKTLSLLPASTLEEALRLLGLNGKA